MASLLGQPREAGFLRRRRTRRSLHARLREDVMRLLSHDEPWKGFSSVTTFRAIGEQTRQTDILELSLVI